MRRRLDILETLHAQHEEYNVHELCEALNVARGTFYNHIFRRADRSKYEKEQAQLMLQVQQIFDDSQQRFGAEKIRIILAENGIHVGKKRIRGIMQELGLESIRENAKKDYKKRQEYQRQNLLEQNFTASRQNEIWVSDITYFKDLNQWPHACEYLIGKRGASHSVHPGLSCLDFIISASCPLRCVRPDFFYRGSRAQNLHPSVSQRRNIMF